MGRGRTREEEGRGSLYLDGGPFSTLMDLIEGMLIDNGGLPLRIEASLR